MARDGKRTGVRYKLIIENKNLRRRKSKQEEKSDDEMSSDEANNHDDKDSNISAEKSVTKVEGPGGKFTLVIKCSRCLEKRLIDYKYSPDKLVIYPGPGDDQYTFTCGDCNKDKLDKLEHHHPKSWGQSMATVFFNLELIHSRQYFRTTDLVKFLESHWEQLAKGRSQSSLQKVQTYLKACPEKFVQHPDRSAYWGLLDKDGKPPTHKGFFVVEKIVGKKVQEQGIRYKVKWAGFNDKYNTWEAVDALNCSDIVENFEKCLLESKNGRNSETPRREISKLPPKKDKKKMERLMGNVRTQDVPFKKEDTKKDESKKDESKKDEPKKDESKKDEPKKEDKKETKVFSPQKSFSKPLKDKKKMHLTCGGCGRYMPIDTERYPEAKTFIYPIPRDFRYIFMCASCHEGSLMLQHLPRTTDQIWEVAKYNLNLRGVKDVSHEQILEFMEEYKAELFDQKPQKREDSSDEESESEDEPEPKSRKEIVRETKENREAKCARESKVENSTKEESKSISKRPKPNTENATIENPPKKQKIISKKKTSPSSTPKLQESNQNTTPSSSSTPSTPFLTPTSSSLSSSNKRKNSINSNGASTMKKDPKRITDDDRDVFLYFEGEDLPFGFVRISLTTTVQELRDMILEEDVAKLKEHDLFIYKKATIKIKQEHKLFIKECILQDEKGQNMILVRKFRH